MYGHYVWMYDITCYSQVYSVTHMPRQTNTCNCYIYIYIYICVYIYAAVVLFAQWSIVGLWCSNRQKDRTGTSHLNRDLKLFYFLFGGWPNTHFGLFDAINYHEFPINCHYVRLITISVNICQRRINQAPPPHKVGRYLVRSFLYPP